MRNCKLPSLLLSCTGYNFVYSHRQVIISYWLEEMNRSIVQWSNACILCIIFSAGALGEAPAAVDHELPTPAGATAVSSDEEEEEVEDMQARLEALRSWSITMKYLYIVEQEKDTCAHTNSCSLLGKSGKALYRWIIIQWNCQKKKHLFYSWTQYPVKCY